MDPAEMFQEKSLKKNCSKFKEKKPETNGGYGRQVTKGEKNLIKFR